MRSGSFTTTHTHDYPDKTVEFTVEVEWTASEGDPPGRPWANEWEAPESPEVDECNATVIGAYTETDELGRQPVHEDEVCEYQKLFDALCEVKDSKIMERIMDELCANHLEDC
jgi:hypothetical protein